jgi:hypothetical protein
MAELRPTRSVINWILLLMAAYSLVTIIVLFRVDTVVNETLYSYGLQFSPDWATLYWTTIRTGFAVSWLVTITAIALQLYFAHKTKETIEEQRGTEPISEEPWCTYTLSDGSTIKVKHKLKSAKRLEKYSPDGIPIYVVDYDNIVQVVNVPEKLTKKPKESSV